MKPWKSLCAAVAVLALSLGSLAAGAAERPQKLVIGLLPGESAPTVMRLNEPLRAYLEQRCTCRWRSSWAPITRRPRRRCASAGSTSPISDRSPTSCNRAASHLQPFARPSHAYVGPTFQATIIVPADSPAKTLADLKGGDIAFGDPASTSGTWVPRWQLLEAGLISDRDYKLRVLGAHDAVALAVANHKVAAGGLSKPVYERLLSEGKIDASKVRVSQDSPAIPEYMWTFRNGLDPEFKEEIRKAFVEIRDPAALAVFRAESFIPCVDSDVDRVRNWIAAIEAVNAQTAWAPQ